MVPYQDLFIALAKENIRYLIAGGFAVNLHQVQRATADLDLIVHLEEQNLQRFVTLMTHLGFQPKLPVDPKDFAKADVRETWLREKNIMVFSFYHSRNSYETVDVFVEEPKPFDELAARKLAIKAFGVAIDVIGLDDLIDLKSSTGRDKDLFDVDQLRKKRK